MIHFTDNGKNRGLGKMRSVIDFFFPIGGTVLRLEMSSSKKNDAPQENHYFTFRTLVKHNVFAQFKWLSSMFGSFKRWAADQYLNGNALSWQRGAIAFDSGEGTRTEAAGTTQSVTHTAAGSNRIAVALNAQAGNYATGTTYNGTAMTFKAQRNGGSGYAQDSYYLIAPTTTAAVTVTVSYTSSGGRVLTCSSFSGADQTTGIGASATGNGDLTSPVTQAITTTAANSILIDIITANQGAFANSFAPQTGQTQIYGSANGAGALDFGGSSYRAQATAAATSMEYTFTNALGCLYTEMIVLEVLAAAPTTAIKTADGLAIASVKTVLGLAIASVKSIVGLQ